MNIKGIILTVSEVQTRGYLKTVIDRASYSTSVGSNVEAEDDEDGIHSLPSSSALSQLLVMFFLLVEDHGIAYIQRNPVGGTLGLGILVFLRVAVYFTDSRGTIKPAIQVRQTVQYFTLKHPVKS